MKTKPMGYYCECGSSMMELRHQHGKDVVSLRCMATDCARRGQVRYVMLSEAMEAFPQEAQGGEGGTA